MKKYVYIIGVLLVAACTGDKVVVSPEETAEQQPVVIDTTQCVAGELLVKFAPEVGTVLDEMVQRQASGRRLAKRQLPSNDEIRAILGEYEMERVFPVDERNEERTREAGLHLWYRITFDEGVNLQRAYTDLAKLGDVQKLQPNRRIQLGNRDLKPVVVPEYAKAKTAVTRAAALPFDDPQLYRQWHLINRGGQSFQQSWAPSIAGCDLGCEEAWQLCAGDPDIIVAVLDEGVMYNHPDLAPNMWVNEAEEFGADSDADGNGYKGDRYGYNFVTDSGIINPYSNRNTGHGTHVAGIIAAAGNNGIGCAGVAGGNGTQGGVRIMSLQIIDGNGACTLYMEAKAMKYAADNGAVVMQCSWGYNSALADQIMGYTPGPSTEKEWTDLYPLEKESIDYFINNAGSPDGVIDGGIAVFAAGNEYSALPAFPAAYSRVVSVSSIAADYTPSTFTNYGKAITFSAPGGDSDYYGTPGVDEPYYDLPDDQEIGEILSTLVIDEQPTYGYYEGTSMACPAVSGVVALGLAYALQNHRHYTPDEFVALMKETAEDLDQYYTGQKLYHYYHTMPGTTTRQMNLADYRGRMGRLPKADALLRAVATGGSAMRIPNVCLSVGKNTTLKLSRYYEGGESLSYQVSISDESVASAQLDGSSLTISGKGVGSTTATITAGDKKETFAITVRKSQTGYGWF